MDGESKLRVCLLSDISMQSRLLKDSLESKLPISVDILSLSEDGERQSSKGKFPVEYVLIDYTRLDRSKLNNYSSFKQVCCPEAKEIAINCPIDVEVKNLLKWQNLTGVFFVDDEITILVKGMEKILQGDMWLSRRLAQDYIWHYRNGNAVVTSHMYEQLTSREQQIIKLLGSGASNIEIAEQLYVSENTVKTHLHNVFKKINVKNRLQALIWAKSNIGLEEANP